VAAGVSARLSPAEARRFGLVIGAAFCLLGALLWWRGRPSIAGGIGALGAALIVLGLIRPLGLTPVYRAWMGLARVISKVTTPILLAAVYFLVITPIGILRRLTGHNPMRARATGGSFWVTRENRGRQRTGMERQF
jgi:hypothetical protein